MRLHLLFLFLLFMCFQSEAQTYMRIHQKDGKHLDVMTEQIDSITFVDTEEQSIETELKGCWLWGNFEAGYYELLTFNDDKTYVGYDNNFTYGFDTTTYGFFSLYSTLLTLWSNGFGYQHRYNWYITGLSTNALSVMTKAGPFTYYRLQPEPIRMALGEFLSFDDDVSVVFADNIIVHYEDKILKALSQGETYILKKYASSNLIEAFKVIVK